MIKRTKTPTLAELRRLAKQKGLLSWPSIRLDNQAGGAWHENALRARVDELEADIQSLHAHEESREHWPR